MSRRKNIHVLLVEHETKDHDTIMNMLNFFTYKATPVKLASTAISILSKGKVRFDFVVANINSPDSLGFQLLHEATKMNLSVIFMSNVDDEVAATKVVEEGALLCVTKSMIMGILGCLWQFQLDKKTSGLINKTQHPTQEQKNSEENPKSNSGPSEHDRASCFKRASSGGLEYERATLKWKGWTLELHGRFMAAAKQLGQGKCYPKDMLELMNEPGLTRMQVASHLQKCRNASWLPPNERKLIKAAHREKPPRKVRKASRAKTLRFGLMPFPPEAEEEDYRSSSNQFHQTFQQYHHENVSINIPPTQTSDRGFEAFDNINMCLNEHYSYGDHQSLVAPQNNMLHNIPGFEQQLHMDFDGDNWQSLILQVDDARNEWFGEAVNPDLEKDGSK